MSLGSDIIYTFHFPPSVCSMAFYHLIQFKSMQSGRRVGGGGVVTEPEAP